MKAVLIKEFGGSETNGTSTSTTTGFYFDDDDANDLLTVDYAIDPVFGTPVFRHAQGGAGQTSCPWEVGAKRDKPYFSITNPILLVAALFGLYMAMNIGANDVANNV